MQYRGCRNNIARQANVLRENYPNFFLLCTVSHLNLLMSKPPLIWMKNMPLRLSQPRSSPWLDSEGTPEGKQGVAQVRGRREQRQCPPPHPRLHSEPQPAGGRRGPGLKCLWSPDSPSTTRGPAVTRSVTFCPVFV